MCTLTIVVQNPETPGTYLQIAGESRLVYLQAERGELALCSANFQCFFFLPYSMGTNLKSKNSLLGEANSIIKKNE